MSETRPSDAPLGSEIPVEVTRGLLPHGMNSNVGISEYIDPGLSSRVISLPVNSEQARSHEELHERRLPVFSAIYRDDKVLLLIPEGTRLLGGMLRSIARDLRNYGGIFAELGATLRLLDVDISDEGVGLPDKQPGRDILDQFAFVLDEEAYGGTVLLTPPYNLNPARKFSQVVNAVHMELTDSKLLHEFEANTLVKKMIEGWEG